MIRLLSHSISNTLKFNRFYSINNKPLKHFKVLDMSRVLAGPWSTQILGDLGCDVIKVEHITKGDDTREWGPPFYRDSSNNQNSAYFSCTNRNKKSIAIDITKPESKDILYDLVRESDVFVENFKVGGLRKYSLDYESLKLINPKIIYCSITGFGQNGPMKDLPGYDFAIQAMGGLMSITGDKDHPFKAGVALVDIMTGLYANIAIQAALHHRNYEGVGQHIDISLFDVQSAVLANQSANYLLTGKIPERIGNSHPSISPYDSLETKDGFIVVAVGNNSQFESLCKALDISGDLINNEIYKTNSLRVQNRASLLEKLNQFTRLKTTSQLETIFSKVNVPCSPINTLDKVYSNPQILSRNMIWELPFNNNNNSNNVNNNNNNNNDSIKIESLKVVGNPIHFSKTDLHSEESIKNNLLPPNLGEHTHQILSSLGYTNSEIENFKLNKIIA